MVIDPSSGAVKTIIPYRETIEDPDFYASYVAGLFAMPGTKPDRITESRYEILIEYGMSNVVVAVVHPILDDTPYREGMKRVMDFIVTGNIESLSLDSIDALICNVTSSTPRWIHYHLLYALLSKLDLKWIGYLDVNPMDTSISILEMMETAGNREWIQSYVHSKMSSQIDSGGTTIGLDIDRIKEDSELARRIDRILFLRKNEMDLVSIDTESDEVDLSSLWLTAYGHQMLSELNVGRTCSPDKYSEIKKAFKKIGIDFNSCEVANSGKPTKMSKGLHEYVLRACEFGMGMSPPYSLVDDVVRILMT